MYSCLLCFLVSFILEQKVNKCPCLISKILKQEQVQDHQEPFPQIGSMIMKEEMMDVHMVTLFVVTGEYGQGLHLLVVRAQTGIIPQDLGGMYTWREASGNANPEVILLTTSFNLNGNNANLDFWVHNRNGNNNNTHTIEIRVTDEAGTSFIGGVLSTYTQTEVNAWTEEQVDLSAYSANGNIRIAFRWVWAGYNAWQHDFAIDDVSISTSSITEICDNGSDEDGDGLVDCLDSDCDLDGACDNDSDGITDRVDKDDDNDGIPDAHECYSFTNLITNSGFESGVTGFSSDYIFQTCTTDCGPGRDVDRGDYAI